MFNYAELLQNKYVQLAGAFAVGAVIGVTLLPTVHKTSEEQLHLQSELKIEKETHEKEVSSLKEELIQQEMVKQTKESEYKAQISSLTSQISELKKHSKEIHYKIIKPDGTVEEKSEFESSEESSSSIVTEVKQQYESKVKEIEEKYKTIHEQRVTELQKQFDSKEQTYKKEIEDLKSKKESITNEKKLGAELGVDQNKNPYFHGTYDAFGPAFIGGNVQKKDNGVDFGVGIGLRF